MFDMQKLVQQKTVITLMGPTASGKTSLGIALAKALETEVISVDSALIYRHMDIGTAKPDSEEQQGIAHHLIDIIEPEARYSVANFRKDVLGLIDALHQAQKIPILVGGTMMYFNALINGLSPLPQACQTTRAEIENTLRQHGPSILHNELAAIDPASAERIHANDPQRLIRAIEVYRLSGKSLSELQNTKAKPLPYNFLQFSIMPNDRAELHQRIARRFDMMLAAGFEQEVRQLRARSGLSIDLPSMRSVGYRQMWQYLDGDLNYAEMRERGIIATRQLAKRQVTWLRGWPALNQLDTLASDNLEKVHKILASSSAIDGVH